MWCVRLCVYVGMHGTNDSNEREKKECEWVKASVMMCHHHLFWTNLYAIHQRASFCCWGCGGRRRRRWRRERERASFCTSSMSQKMCFRLLFHNLSHFAYRFWFLYVKALSHCQPLTYQNHCWMSYFIRIQIWCPVVSWEIIAYACVPMNYQARVCDMVKIVILERKK